MDEATQIHVVVEAMRRAYRERALHMGDADFINVPTDTLMQKGYAKALAQSINLNKASNSQQLSGLNAAEGHDTTHFSIMDKLGNRVAATLSVNYPFGSGFVPEGTGVLLNDEMDDFSSKPGVPNAYGLIGAEANAVAPGKRPLSSMSPTFIENDRGIAILGTPGGSRIITMLLLGALEFAAGGDASAIVQRPRFHHQYMPDKVMYENDAFSEKTVQVLTSRGHVLKKLTSPYGGGFGRYGNMQAVVWDQKINKVTAASDGRGIGAASVTDQ